MSIFKILAGIFHRTGVTAVLIGGYRELVDFPDTLLLLQANDIDIENAEIKMLFDKYGTPELYRKARESFGK